MGTSGTEPAISSDMLDSWKTIAAYLNRDVRTVIRWERSRGLPVHRLPGGDRSGVYALKSELEAWRTSTSLRATEPAEAVEPYPRAPSIAVLPFTNLSADQENEYFSDGLADEIITALTRIQGLLVTARSSSFAFRGKVNDARAAGAMLGVSTLLEGSVQRSGERIRVSAQLVDARNGFHLWSEVYDRQAADVFAIQDELSEAIARVLKVRLAPLPARRAVSLAAYQEWLKGRYYQQFDTPDIARVSSCFQQAIALDPSFPNPYLSLAELLRHAAEFGLVSPRVAGVQGGAAIRKALELDDALGEAHALSGAYRAWMDFDWQGAETDFDRALTLSPASRLVHEFRAMGLLLPTSRLQEAERELERAAELDPLSPLLHCVFAWFLLFARKFDRALEEIETALAVKPDYAVTHVFRGSVLYFLGRTEEAVASWESAIQALGPSPILIGAYGAGLGFLGRRTEARALLGQLDAAEREHYVSPTSRAYINIGIGDFDAAFQWMDRAVDERCPHILTFPSKPLFDPMRSDPRFTALLRKMRLT